MGYDGNVIKRYGSAKQKREERLKRAYYKAMDEIEWRKLAVDSWESLKKEAEFGTRMFDPDDSMVIGVLGQECFDSFKEYKELQKENRDADFIQLASAMIELNKSMIGGVKKVASYASDMLHGNMEVKKVKKMVKFAGKKNEEKKIESKDVAFLLSNVIAKTNDKKLVKTASTFMSDVLDNRYVEQKKVKKFFDENNIFGELGVK